MQMWSVRIGRAQCEITASPGPNGKVFVRAYGKLVTPPIAPAELEREFGIDGWQFLLVREGAAWRLDELGYLPPLPVDPNAALPDHFGRRTVAIIVALFLALFTALVTALPLAARLPDGASGEGPETAMRFADSLRWPAWTTIVGALLIIAFVVSRSPRGIRITSWTMMILLAIGMLRTDLILHGALDGDAGAMPVLTGVHATGLFVLAAAALLSGLAQWAFVPDDALSA
jgi:hypothetical protein